MPSHRGCRSRRFSTTCATRGCSSSSSARPCRALSWRSSCSADGSGTRGGGALPPDRRGGGAARSRRSERPRAPLRDRADGVERRLVGASRARAADVDLEHPGRRKARVVSGEREGDLRAVRLVADHDHGAPAPSIAASTSSVLAPGASRSSTRSSAPALVAIAAAVSRARAAGSSGRAPARPARAARPAPAPVRGRAGSAVSASPDRRGPSVRGGRGRGARG